MGKKSKRKQREKTPEEIVDEEIGVRENVVSYSDYNTIMSIQLLIDRLNEGISLQKEIRSQISSLRAEVDMINAYLNVPGEREDGNEDPFQKVKETLGGAGEDSASGTDE